jgi:hypothetical protein
MTNVAVVNGTFASEEDAALYQQYLDAVRFANSIRKLRANKYGGPKVKLVLRKRYRGPRVAKKRNRQSMCLREHANAVSVYIYEESFK